MLLQTAARSRVRSIPVLCPPDGPYYEGCAAPLIIKLENIFSQVIKFDLQKMLTLFEIQTGLKKCIKCFVFWKRELLLKSVSIIGIFQ